MECELCIVRVNEWNSHAIVLCRSVHPWGCSLHSGCDCVCACVCGWGDGCQMPTKESTNGAEHGAPCPDFSRACFTFGLGCPLRMSKHLLVTYAVLKPRQRQWKPWRGTSSMDEPNIWFKYEEQVQVVLYNSFTHIETHMSLTWCQYQSQSLSQLLHTLSHCHF